MSKLIALPIFALAYLAASAFGTPGQDRDHDGLPDSWERRYDLSTSKKSAKGDPDDDGLRNVREYEARTNPREADTDGDGYYDGAEVRADTDPRDPASHPSTPPPAGCAEQATNVRDGLDPWGGCFPGPSNTGVPDGTQRTDYTGPCRVSTANAVIDAKTVDCDLDIVAEGVVVANSRVNGTVDVSSGGSATVTDTTIDAGAVNSTTNDGARSILGSNFTAIRVEMVRGISGGWCHDCTVRDSWIHGQDRDEGGQAHQSGFRLDADTRLIHNTIRCDAPNVSPDAGCSADVTGYGDFSYIHDNLAEKNLLEWTQSGGFCAYGGSSKSKPFSAGFNNVWRDNIFQRGPSGKCGYYGAMTDLDAGKRGNVWQNNRFDNGELMPSEG